MPELPEVETTRRSLLGALPGARIQSVRLGLPLRWPLGCTAQNLVGRTLMDVQRRGKYLWLPLAVPPGEVEDGLLIHLGMSGSLAFGALPPSGPWDHVEIATDRGLLRLTDPRRFGSVCWSPAIDQGLAGERLAGLGIEPFDPGFGGALLRARWKDKRVAVKQALLAGDAVVGVGNIYASEALFAAGIDPRTPAGRLGPLRCERLAGAVRAVLGRALDLGGSTLRDFKDAHGMDGAFQNEAQVYGREGQPCSRCGPARRVQRIVQGQRATYFCRGCQRP